MASIKERPKADGTLSFLITVSLGRDENKKKIIKTTTFTPKSKAPTKARKEADAFATEFELQVLSGDVVVDDDISFAQFEQIWEKNWLPSKTPGVIEGYKGVARVRVLPYLGHLKLNKIKAPHIDNILKREQAENKAPATVRMTFTVINSIFKYALKKQYIRENPCIRCDELPEVTMRTGNDISFFTEEQTNRFLNDALTMEYNYSIKGHSRVLAKTGETYQVPEYTESRKIPLQWQIYFTMAIYGQFRRGEMCALTWRDLDMDHNIISINKAVINTKYGRVVKGTKTRAGIRDIVMPANLFILLKQWKKEQLELCIRMGTAWKGHRNGKTEDGKDDSFEENTIFIQTNNGLPVHLSTPGHKFAEIVDIYNKNCSKEEDKLPKIRLHDLRHTGATLLLGQNTDIETVSRRLGHSKASVTLDIYGHALPENDKKAAETLEAMFKTM